MFGKLLILTGLLVQVVSGGSLRTQTTVIPRPLITVPPTDNTVYQQLPRYGILYY